MKLIEAFIKPVKLEEVKSALASIGIDEFMESAIFCHGRQKGKAMVYRGAEYVSNLVEKVKLEVIAADDSVGKIIEAIGNIAKTGRKEDCRIFVLPFVDSC
jgi:nitrogen regulatory protein PII